MVAADGELGLRMALEGRPRVVVLDLVMPKLDGFGFLTRFRRTSLGRRTPVIVWTEREISAEERAQLAKSAHAVIRKSGGAAALLQELRLLLPLPSQPASAQL